MDFISFIEYAKVAYHLYLTETLTEYEMLEYLWDAEADVIQYSVDEIVMNYSEHGDVLSSCVVITANLDVSVETNLDF
jgi:pyruvate formate-lyase activating enzyme-like uncharacterized protein